jgi:DNA polymerase-3 subunit epsilon
VKPLPTYYYLSHFHEFLKFVSGPCSALLSDADKRFIKDFMALSQHQQCLIVRFINRKSKFIKPQSYQYDEIEDIQENLSTLYDRDWFKSINSAVAGDFISGLTKDEIITVVNELNEPYFMSNKKIAYKKSDSKNILIEYLLSESNKENICKTHVGKSYWQGNFEKHISYFLYLYFGKSDAKLNQFSMRDLGVMRTCKEQAQIMARFADIKSAKSAFNIHCQLNAVSDQIASLKDQTKNLTSSVNSVHDFVLQQLDNLTCPIGTKAIELNTKLKYYLACELLDHDAVAGMVLLKTINTDSAQEKWVRQAYKFGLVSDVRTTLEAIIDSPLSEDLLAFAEDFYARKFHKKRTSVLTDMLRENSQTLLLDEMYKGCVEKGVVTYYQQKGYQAFRTENDLWRSLFGLYFWQEIYNLEGLGLSNEFDHVPKALKNNQFYQLAAKHIEARLALTASKDKLIQQLSHCAAKYYGQKNCVFKWRNTILERLILLINHSPLDALLLLLKAMAQDWVHLSDGYPDIMLINNNVNNNLHNKALRFEEIKAEGDQLRRNQLLSIQKLQSLGFDVRITNIKWTFDPLQTYAVIDIETTGGRAQQHRITEVGIVKVVGGKVVDEWQSLINPQRRIPHNITALTGIDNNMVAHAPLFSEVADAIDNFTKDCVFVAHNVNFDYGFIKAEFNRLERPYRRPKLCTVREMRKHYKGLASYSLANLTKHFGIDMQRHHRAMSDAVAASELLNMINEKRLVGG